MSEVRNNLPRNWAVAPVEELFDIVGGGTPSTAVPEYWQGDIPWITSADIDDRHKITPRRSISEQAIENSATNLVPAGSVIVVTRVGLGKVGIAETPLCFSQDSQALILPSELRPQYVLFYMGTAVSVFRYTGRGTTISGVTKKQLANLEFRLPPLPEQQRIVGEIEKQFTRLEAGVAALQRVEANLKRYRAAVLKAAVEGRLVPTEAELARAEGRSYEPASELLEQFRRASHEHRIRRDVPRSVEPLAPTASILVPKGWAFESVATLLRVGVLIDVKDGNHGTNHPKRKEFSNAGVSFITAEQVNNFQIDYDGAPKLTGPPLARLRVGFAEPGDTILTHKGTVGRVALCTRSCVLSPQTTYYRAADTALRPEYLVFHHASPQFFSQLAVLKSQTTRDYVPISDQYRLFVLVPPPAEQDRIIREVERRLSVIDELELQVEANLKRAERLRQAIPKRAFEGKLVPQDPDDEPASMLLERMRAERAQRAAEAAKAKKRTGKSAWATSSTATPGCAVKPEKAHTGKSPGATRKRKQARGPVPPQEAP